MDLMVALLNDMLFAAIPAVGFAMVFNVSPKYLPYCAVGGAIAHGIRMMLMRYGVSMDWATLAGSFTVGCIGIYWSKKLHVPPNVFTVASMIPMVPGVLVYKAMISLVEINHRGFSVELWKIFTENFIMGISVISSLAIGLAVPSLVFHRRKPIV